MEQLDMSNPLPLAEESLPNEELLPPTEGEEPLEADPPSEEEVPTEAPAEDEDVTHLKEEIDRLRSLLLQKELEQKKVMQEMEEFSRLFPNTSVREIPNEVWQDVDTGIPLSAAYALYEKKNRIDRLHAEEINRRNAAHSAGNAGVHTPNEYFSPDEVRAMSPSEVREHYKKIRESMKKWRH